MTLDLDPVSLFFYALQAGLVTWIIKLTASATKVKTDATEAKAKATKLEAEVELLKRDSMLHGSVIEDIRSKLSKLDKLDELAVTLGFIKEQMSNFVSKVEFEARVGAVERFVEKQ